MSEFNFKQYLKEGKLIKENREASDDFADNPSMNESKVLTGEEVAKALRKLNQKYDGVMSEDFIIKVKRLKRVTKKTLEKMGAKGKILDDIFDLLKENSTSPSVDSNVAYLVGQIADDMMYGEFDSKEDINKFLDSIITGVEELRSQQLLNFKEITYLPDANPEGDDLEEGRHGPGRRMDESNFNKSLKKASTKLKENKLKKK